jgi:hypothetical protein
VAGDVSCVGNPFLADFILVGNKLEKLGFAYYKDEVTIVGLAEEQKHV